MFTLPSMWNLIISTIVFFITAWYLHRHLDDWEIPRGMTRGILVFLLASLVSWVAGEAVDWVHEKIYSGNVVGVQSANTLEAVPQFITRGT